MEVDGPICAPATSHYKPQYLGITIPILYILKTFGIHQ